MVRSFELAAVVVSLAWTGLAGAQSSALPGTAAGKSHYIIVSEDGQQPQRCQILRTWQDANGAPVFQVQAVETGEVMTILGSGPTGSGGDPRSMSTRIFHWGRDNKPPAGVPMPPPIQSAPVQEAPVVTPQPMRPSTQLSWQSPQAPLSTVQPTPALAQPVSRPATPAVAPQVIQSTPQPNWPTLAPSTSTAPTAPPTQPVALPTRPVVTAQPSPSPSLPAPLMSPTTAQTPSPTPPAPAPATAVVTPQPIRLPPQPIAPPRLATAPVLPPLPTPAAKPAPSSTAPTTKQAQPLSTTSASSNPVPEATVSQTKPVVPSKPLTLTPMGTQVVKYSSTPSASDSIRPTTAASQPRLLPTGGSVPTPNSNCTCSSPRNTCGQPCSSCQQSSCVNCTPSPMRQGFMSRLFKSNPPCGCTEVACQPAQIATPKPTVATPPASAVAQVSTEIAKPRDWHESWGKVEPWKEPAPPSTEQPAAVLTQRVDPTPIRIDPPKQPDPLKAPAEYRDLAMQTKLSNSKMPDEHRSTTTTSRKPRLFASKRTAEPLPPPRRVEEVIVMNEPPTPHGVMPSVPPAATAAIVSTPAAPNAMMPSAPPTTQPQGRVIQMAADEPNAFWSPEKPAKPEAGQPEQPKNNAFDRVENDPPPQGIPPRMGPEGQMPMPPGGRPMSMITPPRGPIPMLPQPPMPPPMPPDMGVADALGNAFTLPGTRRPIPADFGGTPQEPNGFDPMVRAGQGSPPQGYSMPMPGMSRPPMPNMMAMAPQVAMAPPGALAMNPLMSVPPTMHGLSIASVAGESSSSASVPQMLATLKDSLCPSEREAVAEQLSELDWRIQPMVVDCLMKAARQDPAPSVRAACVHALGHMGVDTPESLALVRELKSDRDPRVRHEAEEALGALGDSGIQQASHK